MLITDTAQLNTLCQTLKTADYLAVDTEFLREKTYYPQLALIQVAGAGMAIAVDPLIEGIDLTALWDLMADMDVPKVFHAARNDIELIWQVSGRMPAPVFDTQVAAMVCGFAESVGYETLVRELLGIKLDKSSQFTDWTKRPLTERQLDYALADVIHLREIFEALGDKLHALGRDGWIEEEMVTLTDPAGYTLDESQLWRRIKVRSRDPRVFARVQAVALWREREAKRHNLPRRWVMPDENVAQIALDNPKDAGNLHHLRGMRRQLDEGQRAAVIEAIASANALPLAQCPRPAEVESLPEEMAWLADMLKLLLKKQAAAHKVASSFIATSADIEKVVRGDGKVVPCMQGWRYEIFGSEAERMMRGELGIRYEAGTVSIAPVT